MRSALSAPLAEPDILIALRDCYDGTGANIVDLGLVHSVSVALDLDAPGSGIAGVPARYRVQVGVLSVAPGGDAEGQIVAQIENRLAAFAAISRVEVQVVGEPRWTPDLMAPELRGRLSLAIASRQHSHDLVQIQTDRGKTREDK